MTTNEVLPEWDVGARYRGEWWAAAEPKIAFRGTLRFVARQPRLTILSPPLGQDYYRLGREDTVYGLLDSGELVTLWGSDRHPLLHLRAERHHGQTRTRRRFDYAVRGAHLEPKEDATFSRSAVAIHGLKSWSRTDEVFSEHDSLEKRVESGVASVVGLHELEFGTRFTVTQKVEYPLRVETREDHPQGAILNHTGDNVRVVFEVSPPAPAAYHHYLLVDLQSLLAFSMQTGAPIAGAWFEKPGETELMPFIRKDEFSGNRPQKLHRSQMVLSASVADTAQIFEAWWLAVESLFPAPQVVAQYHHASRGLLEGSTTSAIAAVEHLHDKIGGSVEQFDQAFLGRELKKVLANYRGEEYKDFRQYLRLAFKNNRPTLRTRLNEVVGFVGAERLLAAGFEPAVWIDGVKAVRDKLAHEGSHVDHRGQGASELLDRVNVQTRAILTLAVMKLMGLGDDVLDTGSLVLKRDVSRFT